VLLASALREAAASCGGLFTKEFSQTILKRYILLSGALVASGAIVSMIANQNPIAYLSVLLPPIKNSAGS
jgi:hypothetical protein